MIHLVNVDYESTVGPSKKLEPYPAYLKVQ